MTNIGKPYEGKPHVRFDEEGQVLSALHSSNSLAPSMNNKGNTYNYFPITLRSGEISVVKYIEFRPFGLNGLYRSN